MLQGQLFNRMTMEKMMSLVAVVHCSLPRGSDTFNFSFFSNRKFQVTDTRFNWQQQI